MTKKQITYVTGNQLKIDYLKSVLPEDEFEIIGKKIDCPEIQSDSIEEVAAFSAKWASDFLKCDVLKNDSGLVLPALNGFPSAYSKYVEQTLQADGILALMKGKENREGYYLDAFAYCEYGKEPVVFTQKSHLTIAQEKSGNHGSYFDKICIAKGHTVTMANLPYDEFLKCFNNEGVYKLAEYLKNK